MAYVTEGNASVDPVKFQFTTAEVNKVISCYVRVKGECRERLGNLWSVSGFIMFFSFWW